jgi:8-oxo-dGTP diphosphatase
VFCPRCGQKLENVPPTACAACGYALFVNARPTGSLIVHDDGRFLALKRAREPQAGLWETPGGFCDGWEEPAAAAVREGREELGVEVTLGDFVGMYIGSYAYQDELLPVLDCFYLATLDESSEMAWFALDEPPKLAFETMDKAVRDAALRLGA